MAVNRFDRIDAPDWMTSPFTQTPEGFLVGRACVTNIGIFPYRFADGSIEYELRHPDDVFDVESMASLKMKPVTNDHPPVLLTSDNIKEYQVGNIGDDPFNGDNIHLTVSMIIQDKDTVKDVLNGKREISCGYTADLVDEQGTWLGVPYTKRQKNIRFNHVAVCDKARAGEAARVRLDSGDAIMMKETTASAVSKIDSKEDKMANMRTIQLDKVDYEADEIVIDALKAAEARALSLQESVTKADTAKSVVEAERDSMKARLDEAEKKISELEKAHLDESEIAARVEARANLIENAKLAKAEYTSDMSDMDIRKAVIVAVWPETKLDDKSEAYIMARFDCAMEDLPKAAVADATVRVAGAPVASVVNVDSAERKRVAMIARMTERNKK